MTILPGIILSTILGVDSINAAFGEENINPELYGDKAPLEIGVQNYLIYLFGFITLAAILYGIYGGFLIFTAEDDDDKVKKGKTIIIQSLIGIVVIFLAGPIISLFLGGEGWSGIFSN